VEISCAGDVGAAHHRIDEKYLIAAGKIGKPGVDDAAAKEVVEPGNVDGLPDARLEFPLHLTHRRIDQVELTAATHGFLRQAQAATGAECEIESADERETKSSSKGETG